MSIPSNQIMRYLALLADPDQNRITREAWTVGTDEATLLWAGWQPDSVVSVTNEPPASWYSGMPAALPVSRRRETTETEVRSAQAYELLHQLGILNRTAVPEPARTIDSAFTPEEPEEPVTPPRGTDGLKHLAALDELHREEALGRVGWLFVAGSLRIGDETVPCCFPLFERKVKFTWVRGAFYPQWQGALHRNALLRRRSTDDVEDRVDAFISAGAGSSHRTTAGDEAADLLRAFGIDVGEIVDSDIHPHSVSSERGTVLIPGTGFYLARPRSEMGSPANDLTRWTDRHLSDTALSQLYRASDAALHPIDERVSPIRSALPLNPQQRAAIDRLDTEAVVAVSGPPGTGKTHMIVAAASDAVAQGLSVLIATKSDFAAESTCELLDHYPTPPHVRFGNEEHRRRVADLLSSGAGAGITDAQLTSLEQADDAAWRALDRVGSTVLAALGRKHAFEQARTTLSSGSSTGAPRMLAAGFDTGKLNRAIQAVDASRGARRKRALGKLRRLIGAPDNATIETIRASIIGARAEIATREALDRAVGEDLDDLWAQLDRCESDARASQAILDIARRTRPVPAARMSTAAFAAALRTSLHEELRLPIEANASFLHQLPFWVGTLDEIEATLPANPGMFDLVIFDEASQIDQLAAVPALCRARHVMVVGDPKQLRHTSSLSRQQIEAARTHAEIRPGDDAAILDIATNSLFDVAAAATPITWLTEHFRSLPHLIQFSSERWYNNELRLMTQHPRTENLDAIHVHRTRTRREGATNDGEVRAIVEKIRSIHAAGWQTSVGVITPFTEQAAALEQAIVATFDYQVIRDLRLRVGTVRGVQGTERDIVLLSLVIDDRDFGEALALIEDPHAFNVMTTRARSEMHVFHSFDPAALPTGVLADWFAYERRPPGIDKRSSASGSAWTTGLAEALELAGVRVVTNYPVAGWTVDLVVGEGDAAFGVETTVHPNGPEAHAERHLTLRRAGWHLVSMFENNWLLKTEDAAIHLAGIAAGRTPR